MPSDNALDRLWEKLDAMTDAMLDHHPMDMNEALILSGGLRATAECIAEFYGGGLEYVRGMEMTRRRIRCGN